MLHVAWVSDRRYLPWSATAMRSCADQHPGGGVWLHLVHDGTIVAGDEDALRSMVGATPLSVHRVDPSVVEHLPRIDRFGHIVWLRFLLPDLLPAVERVLYLDADTFVAAPLAGLADHDLDGAPLGAVLNVMPPQSVGRLAELGLAGQGFFNSGVLLLDLEQLRAERLLENLGALVARVGDAMRWPDQDVLNVAFAGRWHQLHPRYNAQNSLFEWAELAAATHGREARQEAIDDPAIVHFEGPYLCKPWHVLSPHPWRHRYREVLTRTPWAEVGLDGDSPLTRVIGRLPESWRLPVYEQVVRARSGKRPSVRGALQRHRHGSLAG